MSATEPLPTSPPARPTPAPLATAPGPAPVVWTDDFSGALASGWNWVDGDPSHWSLSDAPGALRIVTQGESLYLAGRPKNLLLRAAPAGDFEITTKVTFNPNSDFQQAAILIYQDHDNFVLLNRGFCDVGSCPGAGVFLDNEIQGQSAFNGPKAAASSQTTWLRLTKTGTTYMGFYGTDGQTWTELGRVDNPMPPSQVGLTANNANGDPSVPQIPADYDLFSMTVEGTDASPSELTSEQRVATIPVGHVPFRVAIGAGAVWVTDQSDAAVYRIDPSTNQVVATIQVGSVPKGLVAGLGAIWVANAGGTTLSRIDPQTNQVVATIEMGAAPRNLAVGAGSVWVASAGTEGGVSRIDPATNQIMASIKVAGQPTQVALSADASAVWVASMGATTVSRIDPQTNQVVATIDVGVSTLALATGPDAVWVAGENDPTLLRINPATNQVVARIAVSSHAWGIATDTDAIWVTSNDDNTLWQIDPHTNQAVAAFKVGKGPLGVAVGEGDVWVANSFDHTVWRIKL